MYILRNLFTHEQLSKGMEFKSIEQAFKYANSNNINNFYASNK